MSPARLTITTASAAAAATAAITLLPFLHLAYLNPGAHVALETAAVLVASMTGFLVVGRFRRTRRLDDLLLAFALVLFALSNLVFGAMPRAGLDAEAVATWAPLTARLLAAGAFATAAFAPATRIGRPDRAIVLALLAATGLLAAVGAAVAALASLLPQALDVAPSPSDSTQPFLVANAGLLGGHLVGVVVFAAAAVGYARKAGGDNDPLLELLGPAAALLAFASVNYLLVPSIDPDWVYTGDAFRLGFYVLLLAAAAQEVRSYWHRLAEAATREERRRIARELHDGAAQDLAFVVMEARRARVDPTPEALTALVAAAERGLDESRRAVEALTEPPRQALDVTIARAAELVATRAGARVDLDLDDELEVAADVREHLIRIVREAVTNAVRHGNASIVSVSLRASARGLRLAVADGGSGFLAREKTPGFGLTSMRERAARIGGRFQVTSERNVGTTVEVLVP